MRGRDPLDTALHALASVDRTLEPPETVCRKVMAEWDDWAAVAGHACDASGRTDGAGPVAAGLGRVQVSPRHRLGVTAITRRLAALAAGLVIAAPAAAWLAGARALAPAAGLASMASSAKSPASRPESGVSSGTGRGTSTGVPPSPAVAPPRPFAPPSAESPVADVMRGEPGPIERSHRGRTPVSPRVEGGRPTTSSTTVSADSVSVESFNPPVPTVDEFLDTAADFVELAPTTARELGTARLMRVRLPEAALRQLLMTPPAPPREGYVQAEVLLGDDGFARAIRLVR